VIYSSTTILNTSNHDVPRDVKDVFVIPAQLRTLQFRDAIISRSRRVFIIA